MTSNMNCFSCDREACIFYIDEEHDMAYNMCRHCGKIWRVIAGCIPKSDKEANEITMIDAMPLNIFESYTDAVARYNMLDCVHRCFVCRSFAFETSLGFYRCSNANCGFEWELEID